ncbi:relaxase/mobilization nuclease domain-containing protein, partial [Campylobacter jejuni]
MIGKGKSISHGVAALEYDLAKEINGQAVATEIARHELYGCTGAEMVQEMKPYPIAKERNFVQSQDIGKVNKAEIKEAMDGVLKKMQGFDFTKFKEELGKRGFKVREARA